MPKWYMMSLVGTDKPGIVAHVTTALFEGGARLGETTMSRLSGNCAIMMMVEFEGRKQALADSVQTIVDSFGLQLHLDPVDAQAHKTLRPDVRISVSGADGAGIVAKVTSALAEIGLHILRLESQVAGSEPAPTYVMHIEGLATEGRSAVKSVVEILNREGFEATFSELPGA